MRYIECTFNELFSSKKHRKRYSALVSPLDKQLTSGGLFMKGRALLFSALKAVEDFATWAGAKAAAEPARRERAVIFIMVSV